MSEPRVILAKTADYSLAAAGDCGTIFTNRGAGGAVNFTLPTTTAAGAGWWCEIFNVAAQNVTITAGTADTMIVFNDATADSLAYSTSGQIIGSGARVVHDGTGWLVFLHPATTGGAQTTATATIAT